MKTWLAPVLASAIVAGCGYHPAAGTNTAAPSYQADLESCRDSSAASVNKQNAKRGLDWFASPVRRWGQIDDATTSCMAGKGYATLRWCTPDELRSGSRTGAVVVTSSGVQCSDPPGQRKPS